jgi:hypothetical protein
MLPQSQRTTPQLRSRYATYGRTPVLLVTLSGLPVNSA